MNARKIKPEITGIAFIGAGRLARAFLPALRDSRYSIMTVAATSLASARRVCRLAPGAVPKADAAAAAAPAGLVLMAVPDAVITPLCRKLAHAAEVTWRGKIVLHHAGALGPEALAPLEGRGASTGLLHPLQTLGDSDIAARLLRGSRARIEGSPRARSAARNLARALRLVPLPFDSPLTAQQRIMYHAAASMLSNDFIALLGTGTSILESAGLDRRTAIEALAPLVRGTLLQAEQKGLGAAFSGPVARGDVETLASHLRTLSRRSRAGERIHRLLSRHLLRLAELEGKAPPLEARRRLKRLLHERNGGRS
jgi:predicted short-subunit dehydrogenase-like oxidoreductase (DUF2520 family)